MFSLSLFIDLQIFLSPRATSLQCLSRPLSPIYSKNLAYSAPPDPLTVMGWDGDLEMEISIWDGDPRMEIHPHLGWRFYLFTMSTAH